MLKLQLDQTATPIYRQIIEQIKMSIATDVLKPGDHLPTVRQLASNLGVNPGTVVRAYIELEKEQIIISRRGGGTIVSTKSDDPVMNISRQGRLSTIVSNHILDILSQGYNPEELEAMFHLHLSRWREHRKAVKETPEGSQSHKRSGQVLRIVGSHDLAFNMLISQYKYRRPEITVDVTYSGSLGGLIALQEERADVAGIHLLDEETGEYNYPYIKRILPGTEMAIVHLAYRIQGLMFASDNPKQIKGLDDLKRRDVVFVNRQKGSGTRVLLDLKLRQHGISPTMIKGYEQELDTHVAVASRIAQGEGDVGLGIEAAAYSYGLQFLPLLRERYDLVIPIEEYKSERLAPLVEIITSKDYRNVVNSIGGYDTVETGTTTFFRQ
jgi:molybdate-binding protein/DNA-binding transcriptional regulator YhcF (GntR family)